MVDRRKHAPAAFGLYYSVAALLGLAAHTLLASPLCHESARVLRLWSLVSIGSSVVASLVAAGLLRALIRGTTTASLLAAGVLHPFVSSFVFVPLLITGTQLLRGEVQALPSAMLYAIYGPLFCGLTAYLTVPLGIAGVWLMRTLWHRGGAGGSMRRASARAMAEPGR
ncbi:MAG: hypothetical protein H6835_08885 [Planctomycetes bacterium]|nr:hypothetical protein [Planctomycetota bacterium]